MIWTLLGKRILRKDNMKLSFLILLTIYVVYNYTRYNNDRNFYATLGKHLHKENVTHRQYFRPISRRRNGGKQESEGNLKRAVF